MDFKSWLLQNEIAGNYGADLPLHRPEKRLSDEAERGTGAMPQFDGKPLPGNTRAMKKKSKKK